MGNPDTAVVIPVYNEATVIASVVEGVLRHVDKVVCVDDGSSDGSADEIAKTRAHLVRHPVNLGQGAALQTGLEYALLDPAVRYFVTYDADGQHRMEDVLTMLDVARQQHVDVVFGSRFLGGRSEVGGVKRVVLKLAVAYMNASSGIRLTDAHNGLRVLTRPVVERLDLRQNGMAHASELVNKVSKGGYSFAEVPVHILYTDYSKGKGQSLLNSVNILFDMLFR
ncbi:MAG: glycosyltransferase family 2 protein [Actinomycetes bacterium]